MIRQLVKNGSMFTNVINDNNGSEYAPNCYQCQRESFHLAMNSVVCDIMSPKVFFKTPSIVPLYREGKFHVQEMALAHLSYSFQLPSLQPNGIISVLFRAWFLCAWDKVTNILSETLTTLSPFPT